jgi:SPOR domain
LTGSGRWLSISLVDAITMFWRYYGRRIIHLSSNTYPPLLPFVSWNQDCFFCHHTTWALAINPLQMGRAMQSKQSSFFTLISLLTLLPVVYAQSSETAGGFTLQVASFPERALAEKYIGKLVTAGEMPGWGMVELPGRGEWTRVFLGSFKTVEAARQYGVALMNRGVIEDFIVKTERDTRLLSRPRSVTRPEPQASNRRIISTGSSGMTQRLVEQQSSALNSSPVARRSQPPADSAHLSRSLNPKPAKLSNYISSAAPPSLPTVERVKLSLAPAVDTSSIPRADPVRLAFRLIIGEAETRPDASGQRGGLWVTGDVHEGMARLRWIVGSENADLIALDKDGRAQLNGRLLAKAAKVSQANSLQAPLAVAAYITRNEGLFLLVQITQGTRRYRLHIGRVAPTLGEPVEVGGGINLDNNYDSRINPYRRNGKKLDAERPPAGFDSLVAINPIALWFNLERNSLVPVGHITFHELAEAQAKLDLNLDYLAQGGRPGAHNLAIDRERMLKAQRPFSDVILTYGSNRVLRSEEEIRQFYLQSGNNSFSQR